MAGVVLSGNKQYGQAASYFDRALAAAQAAALRDARLIEQINKNRASAAKKGK
jgi:hypothetical protein